MEAKKTTKPPPHLPDELVFSNILTRLPVKSLYRFSCASKLWCNIIHHDKNFIASHLNHAKANPSLLAIFQYQPFRYAPFRYGYKQDVFYRKHFISFDHNNNNNNNLSMAEDIKYSLSVMVGSCNGLICFFYRSERRYEICNPSTQEVLCIPPCRDGVSFCGFGYDSLKAEYKVVHVRQPFYNVYPIMCMIYTLGTNSWRNITEICNISLVNCFSSYSGVPVLSNGVLHWLDCPNSEILLFDIHREIFQLISVPEQSLDSSGLLDVGGCLMSVDVNDEGEMSFSHVNDEGEMYLYILKEHNSLVMKDDVFVLPCVPVLITDYPFDRDGLITRQQEISIYYSKNNKIRLYNAESRSMKELQFPKEVKGGCYVISHIENLLPLKTLLPDIASEEQLTYMSSRRGGRSIVSPTFVDFDDDTASLNAYNNHL